MASFKTARLSEDILRELTDIFRGLKDPRVDPMLSIVKVDLSGDQSSCKVYVSSVAGMEKAKESVKGLTSGAGYIRRELGRRLQVRHTPELRFLADDSIEHSAKIAGKLREIGPLRGGDPAGTPYTAPAGPHQALDDNECPESQPEMIETEE